MPDINRPSSPDVTRGNSRGVIYVLSKDGAIIPDDEHVPNGSIRFVVSEDSTNAKIEYKSDGAWNLTGFDASTGSFHLGPNMDLGATGDVLRTISQYTGKKSLIPQATYDDSGSFMPTTTMLGEEDHRSDQPIFDGEVSGTDIEDTALVDHNMLVNGIYFKTGSIGSTANVRLTFHKTDETGPIIWERNLPADTFGTPNADVKIDLRDKEISAVKGENWHIRITSINPVSVKINSNTGKWYWAVDYQLREQVSLVGENLMFTEINSNYSAYESMLSLNAMQFFISRSRKGFDSL